MKNIKNIKIVSNEQKRRMMDVLSGAVLAPSELTKYKKMLPASCFVSGNKAVLDMDAVEKYLVSTSQLSFATDTASRWKSSLLNIEGKEERYVAMKVLAATDYGCQLTQPIYQLIADIAKVEVKKVSSNNADKTLQLVKDVCDILDISPDEYYKSTISRKAMTTTMIENAVKNINARIKKSKDKRIVAKDIKIMADPSMKEMKADVRTYGPKCSISSIYKGTNMRPDILLAYNAEGERKYLVEEHFGWHGSESYNAKQQKKVQNCIDNMIPMFITADSSKSIHLDKATGLDGLEEKVWTWQLNQIYLGETEMDAVVASLYNMMEYAGILKFMPTPDKLFLKN